MASSTDDKTAWLVEDTSEFLRQSATRKKKKRRKKTGPTVKVTEQRAVRPISGDNEWI